MKTKHKRYLVIAAMVLMMTVILAMIGCAPRVAEPKQPGTGDPGNGPTVDLGVWTIDKDCTSCHATAVASITNTGTATAIHYAEPGVSCVTCHIDTGGALTTGHANYASAAEPTRLKKSNVSNSTCLTSGCHVKTELIAATASVTILTDSDGTTVNPHDVSDSDSHNEGVTCAACHKVHSPTSQVESNANTLCVSCHHEHVFECNTCHD
ncbi:MAG: cytochrome c3 family protein [Coriobacteriales bacterium]|jgi:hypothetical protein|nr:cytochrome c3 family protein [Coriobacteriales bacterium]